MSTATVNNKAFELTMPCNHGNELNARDPRLFAVVEFRQQFEVFLGRGGQFRRLLGGVFEVGFHEACDLIAAKEFGPRVASDTARKPIAPHVGRAGVSIFLRLVA